MNGCPFEYTPFLPTFVSHFRILGLQDNADAFNKEHKAENWEHQLFVYDDCDNSDNATDGKAAGVAHEDLSWVGIVPKKANESADKCAQKNYKFF